MQENPHETGTGSREIDEGGDVNWRGRITWMLLAISILSPLAYYGVRWTQSEDKECLVQLVVAEAHREKFFYRDAEEIARLEAIVYTKLGQTAEGESGGFYETTCANVRRTMPTLGIPYVGAARVPQDSDLWLAARWLVYKVTALQMIGVPPSIPSGSGTSASLLQCVRWYCHDTYKSSARCAWHGVARGRKFVITIGGTHFYCRA